LISTAKILGVTQSETRSLQEFVSSEVPDIGGLLGEDCLCEDSLLRLVPDMPRVRSVYDWFTRNSLIELAALKQAIDLKASRFSDEVGLLLKLSFSRIVVAASKQQGESTYRRVEKDDQPGRVVELFRRSVQATVRACEAFNREARAVGLEPKSGRLERTEKGYRVHYRKVSASIYAADSRDLDGKIDGSAPLADLVVTSPPYLMSWDYGLYHKFRFYWLGYDLDRYEESEIGRHLRRKDDDIERYSEDMSRVFDTLRRSTAADATIVMVNAPSVVKGKSVDTNEILRGCGREAMWECVSNDASVDIPGPHHGMYASLDSRGATLHGVAGKREHVLVFKKK